MPHRAVNGLRLHVQQAGEGPDVILIHGVTGDLSIWFLCRAMQALAADYRVTAFDLRGHGYSEVTPSGYTSADHAADVLALMDEIGADRARIVGHSFGAVIAAHTAVLAPDRVEAVVLSDPYFPALRHLEDVSRWGHWQNFRREAEDAGVILSDEHWYDLGQFFDQVLHLSDDDMLKFRRAVGLPGTERLLRLCQTTCGEDTKVEAGLTVDRIGSIHVPVLALYGEASPFLATADYLVEHLPDCRRALVPGARHRAPEENPEAFLAALTSFLESVDSARAMGDAQ
ncbi:alpha/beta fold hydrolase [Tautonia marina]|uniref:alpha/beta fold hydrolase n=1 Tax=Tautonia marina TaxID=2653855 RepID=UPI001260EEA7|nr:alpha/beta hydrolase [Tautonia marina]